MLWVVSIILLNTILLWVHWSFAFVFHHLCLMYQHCYGHGLWNKWLTQVAIRLFEPHLIGILINVFSMLSLPRSSHYYRIDHPLWRHNPKFSWASNLIHSNIKPNFAYELGLLSCEALNSLCGRLNLNLWCLP